MRTSGSLVGGLLVVAALLLGLAIRSLVASPVGGVGVAVLPDADAAELGIQVQAMSSWASAIPESRALATANAQWVEPPGKVDAFLQLVTDPNSLRADSPILNRPVWIVRYSGISIVSPAGRTIRTAYAFVDAITGEDLGTRGVP